MSGVHSSGPSTHTQIVGGNGADGGADGSEVPAAAPVPAGTKKTDSPPGTGRKTHGHAHGLRKKKVAEKTQADNTGSAPTAAAAAAAALSEVAEPSLVGTATKGAEPSSVGTAAKTQTHGHGHHRKTHGHGHEHHRKTD